MKSRSLSIPIACCIIAAMLMLVTQSTNAQHTGGSYDGYANESSSLQTLNGGTLTNAKYFGSSYDGYATDNSSLQTLTGGSFTLSKYIGGSYDGFAQDVSNLQTLGGGIPTFVKFYGGFYDGFADDKSLPLYLDGSPLPPVPVFTVFPRHIDFGVLNIGMQGKDSVTVTNLGGDTLTISSVFSDDSEFVVTPDSTKLSSFMPQKFLITFTLTSFGAKLGHIIFTNNASSSPDTVVATGRNFSIYASVTNGWNMISLPVTVSDTRKVTIFPTATSHAFAYQGNYVQKDSLRNGVGYWLKFSSPQTVEIKGEPRMFDTIGVTARWNMIGSISTPISVHSVGSIPSDLIVSKFYGYKSSVGYVVADTIKPGFGYWVKANQAGKLILSSAFSSTTVNVGTIHIVPSNELPPSPPEDEHAALHVIPSSYSLSQNYPNPFNPGTSISYEMPTRSHVKLEIINTLGQSIATLVDQVQEAGFHQILWEGNVSSGVYFYRIIAEEISDEEEGIPQSESQRFVSVKKMLLLR